MFHSKFIFLKILFFIFLGFLFIFLALHIFLSYNLKYRTEIVYCYDVPKTINSYGVVFKDEKILNYCENGEIIKNNYKDGNRVAANSEISKKYYKETDIKNLKKAEKIENKINSLVKLQNSINKYDQNFNDLNNQIYRDYLDLSEALNKSDYQLFCKLKDKIINCLNKKQVLIGKIDNFDDSIEFLKKEKNSIINSISSKPKRIKTPISGYISSKIDGFENECSLETMENLDANQLQKLYDRCCKNRNKFKLGNKIIYNPRIFLKVLIPNETTIDCSVGSKCSLNLQQIGEDVEAELVELILGKNGQKGLVTFEINCMTEKLSSLRESQVKINFKNYYGLKISKSAIRKNEKNQTGVYIKTGAMLRFKLVDILTENLNFVISKVHNDDLNYVRELDEVIVKGKNLYEGKRIK